MSARHNTSHDQRSNILQHGENQLYKEQQKIPDSLAPLSHSPLNLGYRPNSSVIGYPLIMPTMELNVTDTTYRLNHGDRGSNYVRLTASGTSLTLIFQGLVKGKAEVVILDITINNTNFTTLTIQPTINNLTLPAISNGARFILEIIAYRDLEGNIHYQQLNGGSGGVVSTPTTGLTFPLVYGVNDIGLVGGSGGSRNVNIDLGDSTAPHIHKITLAQNARINFTNVPQSNQGLFFVLQIQQDEDGAHGIFSPQAVTDWDLDLSPNALTILTGMVIGGDIYITNFGSRITQIVEDERGGSAEDWANHPAVGSVDLAGNIISRVGLLQFNPQNNVVSQIRATPSGIVYTAGAARGHRFESVLNTALLTLGADNMDIHGLAINTAAGINFENSKSIHSGSTELLLSVANNNSFRFAVGTQNAYRLNNGGLDMNENRIYSVTNLTFFGSVPSGGHIRLPRAGQIAWRKTDGASLILDVNTQNELRLLGGHLTLSGNDLENVGRIDFPQNTARPLPSSGEIRMQNNSTIQWTRSDRISSISLGVSEDNLNILGGNLDLWGNDLLKVDGIWQQPMGNDITFHSEKSSHVLFDFRDAGETQFSGWTIARLTISGHSLILQGGLLLNNSGAAPIAPGFSRFNDDIWINTGGALYNMTTIAQGGSGTGTTPSPGGGVPWATQTTLQSGHTILGIQSTRSGLVQLLFNQSGEDANVAWQFSGTSLSGNNIILNQHLLFNDNIAPIAVGISRVGADLWVHTGGQARNLTDAFTTTPVVGDISLTSLSSSIVPDADFVRLLGATNRRWGNIFTLQLTTDTLAVTGTVDHNGTHIGLRNKTPVPGRVYTRTANDIRRRDINFAPGTSALTIATLTARSVNALIQDLQEQGIIL